MGYLLMCYAVVALKVVRGVALLAAVVVMRFYQGVGLHYTNMANVSHLGGICTLLVSDTPHLGVVVVCSSCIYQLLPVVVS